MGEQDLAIAPLHEPRDIARGELRHIVDDDEPRCRDPDRWPGGARDPEPELRRLPQDLAGSPGGGIDARDVVPLLGEQRDERGESIEPHRDPWDRVLDEREPSMHVLVKPVR